jgi:hypothetical protein
VVWTSWIVQGSSSSWTRQFWTTRWPSYCPSVLSSVQPSIVGIRLQAFVTFKQVHKHAKSFQ